MLRRILAGFSIASLLVGVIVLIFWWRSFRHFDHFSYGALASRQTEYTSHGGIVMMTVRENFPEHIRTGSYFYAYSRIVGGCLVIPAFWLAIWIRSKLPRPPGRVRRDYLPPLDSSRF